MDALLIVSGIVAMLIAWIWLVLQARTLGMGLLLLAIFLPLITLFVRRRGYALMPRLLLFIGLLLMLAGGAWLYRDQPERFDSLLGGDWVARPSAQDQIEGELVGQRFLPDRVFWKGNELVLEEGEADRVRRSLRIRFANAPDLLRRHRMEWLPGDAGSRPELVLQWYTGALETPGLRRIIDGYSLSLDFNTQADGRTRVGIHLHLPGQDATRLSGDVWLEETPAWLKELERKATRAQPVSPVNPAVPPPSALLPAEPQADEWQSVSLLALLDEPELFIGQNIRLTTVTDRVYEGLLKAVSGDQRVVVAQPRGPNQVDYHFHPLDIRNLEMRYRSSR